MKTYFKVTYFEKVKTKNYFIKKEIYFNSKEEADEFVSKHNSFNGIHYTKRIVSLDDE